MTPKKAEAPGRAEGNDETRPTSNRILAPAADGTGSYDRVVAALRARGCRHNGKNWECPAHDDRNPSLSVTPAEGDNGSGKVLLHCHAGCSVKEVCSALGLELSELFDGGSAQVQLFDRHAYSMVGIEIYLKMPSSASRNFSVATMLGRFLPVGGGRRQVTSQVEIVAVLLERKQRKMIRDKLDVGYSNLSNFMTTWEEWGIAHRCSQDVWALFVRPSDHCPACRTSLVGEVAPVEPAPAGELHPLVSSPDGDGNTHDARTTGGGFFKDVEPRQSDIAERALAGAGVPIARDASLAEIVRALEKLRLSQDRIVQNRAPGAHGPVVAHAS